MDLIITREQGRVPITVIHIQGRIDSGAALELEQTARDLISHGGRHILIDLKNVTYLSSSGLRVLHLLLLALHPTPSFGLGPYKSRNLKLLDPPENVLNTISIAGFDTYFEIYIDLKTAVASF